MALKVYGGSTKNEQWLIQFALSEKDTCKDVLSSLSKLKTKRAEVFEQHLAHQLFNDQKRAKRIDLDDKYFDSTTPEFKAYQSINQSLFLRMKGLLKEKNNLSEIFGSSYQKFSFRYAHDLITLLIKEKMKQFELISLLKSITNVTDCQRVQLKKQLLDFSKSVYSDLKAIYDLMAKDPSLSNQVKDTYIIEYFCRPKPHQEFYCKNDSKIMIHKAQSYYKRIYDRLLGHRGEIKRENLKNKALLKSEEEFNQFIQEQHYLSIFQDDLPMSYFSKYMNSIDLNMHYRDGSSPGKNVYQAWMKWVEKNQYNGIFDIPQDKKNPFNHRLSLRFDQSFFQKAKAFSKRIRFENFVKILQTEYYHILNRNLIFHLASDDFKSVYNATLVEKSNQKAIQLILFIEASQMSFVALSNILKDTSTYSYSYFGFKKPLDMCEKLTSFFKSHAELLDKYKNIYKSVVKGDSLLSIDGDAGFQVKLNQFCAELSKD